MGIEHAPAFCLLPFLRSLPAPPPTMASKFTNKNKNPTNKGSHLHMPGSKSGRRPRPNQSAAAGEQMSAGRMGTGGGGRAGRRGGAGPGRPRGPLLTQRPGRAAETELSAPGTQALRRHGVLGRVEELPGARLAATTTGHRHRRGHGYWKGHRHGAPAAGYGSKPPGSGCLEAGVRRDAHGRNLGSGAGRY